MRKILSLLVIITLYGITSVNVCCLWKRRRTNFSFEKN